MTYKLFSFGIIIGNFFFLVVIVILVLVVAPPRMIVVSSHSVILFNFFDILNDTGVCIGFGYFTTRHDPGVGGGVTGTIIFSDGFGSGGVA